MDSPAPLPMKRLADYRPPDWLVPSVELDVALDPVRTRVRARLAVARNGTHDRPLVLDAEALALLDLWVDGRPRPLPPTPAGRLDGELVVPLAGERAVVEALVELNPSANSRLMGLYSSGGTLLTQCEAEGFRRIVPFPDRPDVLARWRVRLEADEGRFPVLLANGNRLAAGRLSGGRHFAIFDDPWPKPCYLFALVAGDLACRRDRFRTRSGRDVELMIWAESADIDRTAHAMASLKTAFAFDEARFGREYDLDQYHIVAVRDFNFGAMENKGLNIFNARYVLADPETATDSDLDAVAAVVAHEYFHNWSGNRVTCRDWFQLSLKEGFTVYRDQLFSESLGSAAVRRIEGIRSLRSSQFAEDSGPLAHPVRPDHYAEISNFYTATVYDKGAEIIRMMAGRLGPERFRRATDRYFADHDGRAATVEDFLAALGSEGLDSGLFARWYRQPGTPRVTATLAHDPATGVADLRLVQSNPKAGPEAEPLPIVFPVALFAPDGRLLAADDGLVLTETETRIRFEGVDAPPILSANRRFASPVIVEPRPTRAELAVLAAHEPEPLARYEAMQQLMLSALLEAVAGDTGGFPAVVAAAGALLADWDADPAFTAETLLPPSEALIAEAMTLADPPAIHAAREALRRALLAGLGDELWAIWHACGPAGDDRSGRAKGLRRLKGIALSLLMADDGHEATAAAFLQFCDAPTMTERMSALTALSHSNAVEREAALARFHDRYSGMPDVLDKWFQVQAASTRADTRAVVERLASHGAFDPRNPNRLRALVLGFALNQTRFHDERGLGYALLARHVLEADRLNPQSAARLVQPLTRWQRFVAPFGELMRAELARVAARPGLSRDLMDVVTTGLMG
ncbi:MAG: aminopeptidase N [Sphingomonadaceae bacterium]